MFFLRKQVSLKVWLLGLFLIALGLATHYFLFFRSELRPFINEGHPHNLKLFEDYILRKQYGVTSFTVRRATWLYQFKEQFFKYFSWQFFEPLTISNWTNLPQELIRTIGFAFVSVLGFFGIYYHKKQNKHSFFYWLMFYFWTSIAMVIVINLSDKEVRERDYFYVTAYNYWTVWMAIGSIGIIKMFESKKVLFYTAISIMLFFPVLNLTSQYFTHDRSKEYVALDYGLNLLNSLEEDAIIFTNGDNDTFPLWYAQAVEDKYANEYIHPKKNVEPSDEMINQKIRAMEFKNEYCNGVRKDVSIANLSLLNTPWYIQQIRDREGILINWNNDTIENLEPNPIISTDIKASDIISWKRLLMNLQNPVTEDQRYVLKFLNEESKKVIKNWKLSEEIIDEDKTIILEAFNKMLVKRMDCLKLQDYSINGGVNFLLNKWYLNEISKRENMGINRILLQNIYAGIINNKKTFVIEGTKASESFSISFEIGQIMYIKDWAVLKIIMDNYGQRPIYFAVTAPDRVGFENNIRNEGMVDRVVSKRGNFLVDIARTKKNVDEVYSYRGIFDDTIFKDKNMTRLLNNYGAPYMRLSQKYIGLDDFENALKYMKKGIAFYSEKSTWSESIMRLYFQYVLDLFQKQKHEQAINILLEATDETDEISEIIEFAYQLSNSESKNLFGKQVFDKLQEKFPENEKILKYQKEMNK